MNYIKRIILENFQSHKYTELELDKYLNVIVGPSDQGKTAIIRGLKWALFNEPTGDFFIREGESECSVTVIFNNNIEVKRYRSKTKNYYYLYDVNGEETVYEGFGTKVPEEIINKTLIRKIFLDSNQTNAINIGEQLEGPFLLSEKNSTRANSIGRLVGVHIVDDALKDTLKDIRNLSIKRKNYEESLKGLNNSLDEYEYLDTLIEKLKKLKFIKENIYNNQLKLDKLTQYLELLKKINKEICLLDNYLIKLKKINEVSIIEQQLSQNIRKHKHITKKHEDLSKVRNSIKYDENLLTLLDNTEIIERKIKGLLVDLNRLKKLKNLLKEYVSVKREILSNKDVLISLKNIRYIEKNIGLIGQKYMHYLNINSLKIKMDNINKSLSIGKLYMDKLSNIDSISNKKDLLSIKYNLLKDYTILKKDYDVNKNKAIEIKNKIAQFNREIKNLLEKYRTILNKVEICPLCFSSIDKIKIDKIISTYKKEDLH